jgi:hypothetical protein
MSRQQRDLPAERAALQAAADRLLAGTPLRSASVNLTVTELITESRLRRDTVYRDHRDLVDDYRARVRAQTFTPDTLRELTEERDQLKARLAETTDQLRHERHTTATLRRVVAEASLELQQAHEHDKRRNSVGQLPPPTRTRRKSASQPGPDHIR